MVTPVEPSSRHEASVEAAVSLVDAASSKETTTPEKEAESSDLDGAIEARSDASADALQDRAGSEVPLGCPPMALVCDDFEDGNLDGWNKLESGGALVIDAAHASSGKSALSIVIPGNQRGGFLERKGAPLFPLPNNTIWGRVMVYFDSLPDGQTDFVRAAPTGGNPPWYNVGEQHGGVMLNYYSSASDCWARPSPPKTLPLKTWMCWEWSFDGTKNEMQFFIDGQLSRRVNGSGDGCSGPNSWTAPQFNTIRVGEYIAELSSTPVKMWLDDVAIGNNDCIGCPVAR